MPMDGKSLNLGYTGWYVFHHLMLTLDDIPVLRLCGYILGYGRPDYYRSVYEDAAQGDGLIKIYITDNPDKQKRDNA